ncbi:MAG: S9 family peptidase, partial [Candidatus Saccharimonadales bacterium]
MQSFLVPRAMYRFNPATKEYQVCRTLQNPINPDNYTVNQAWYVSKDGTRVPMFIVHKKGIALDGKNPTVLLGYGGFGAIETPKFSNIWIPWLERGGIFAVANMR